MAIYNVESITDLKTTRLLMGVCGLAFFVIGILITLISENLKFLPLILIGAFTQIAWTYGNQKKKFNFMLPSVILYAVNSILFIISLFYLPKYANIQFINNATDYDPQASGSIITGSMITLLTVVATATCVYFTIIQFLIYTFTAKQ